LRRMPVPSLACQGQGGTWRWWHEAGQVRPSLPRWWRGRSNRSCHSSCENESDVWWLTDFPDPAAIHSDLLEDIAASNITVESLWQHGE